MAAEHFTKAEKIFGPEVVERLAEIGQFRPSADLDTFREMICLATGFYLEELDAPDGNKIAREIKDLFHGKISLDDATETTRHYIQQRAKRLGKPWPPTPRRMRNLVVMGGICSYEIKRQKNRRKIIYTPVMFAPSATRNPKRRVAATVLVVQLRAAYQYAAGKVAPETATMRFSTQSDESLIGPFARFASEVFRLCETPTVNVVRTMNQARLLMIERPTRS
jgi:hypothetical protein